MIDDEEMCELMEKEGMHSLMENLQKVEETKRGEKDHSRANDVMRMMMEMQ